MEEKIANDNFRLWNEALQTSDPEKVVLLYDTEATFLPTFSKDFKKGKEEAKEYFEHFLLKKPIGKIIKEEIQFVGDICYIHSGLYNFEVDADNGRKISEARFTFVWRKNKTGEWKIIHHHSSALPK